jgi:hypothetical protein
VFGFLASVIREEKEVREIQTEKEEVKLFLFACHNPILKTPKYSTTKLLDLINTFSILSE